MLSLASWLNRGFFLHFSELYALKVGYNAKRVADVKFQSTIISFTKYDFGGDLPDYAGAKSWNLMCFFLSSEFDN